MTFCFFCSHRNIQLGEATYFSLFQVNKMPFVLQYSIEKYFEINQMNHKNWFIYCHCEYCWWSLRLYIRRDFASFFLFFSVVDCINWGTQLKSHGKANQIYLYNRLHIITAGVFAIFQCFVFLRSFFCCYREKKSNKIISNAKSFSNISQNLDQTWFAWYLIRTL